MHQASRREYVGDDSMRARIDSGQLLIMLYDSTIRFIARARIAMASGKAAEKELLLKKAEEILISLSAFVDDRQLSELESSWIELVTRMDDSPVQDIRC